jgi:translocation and assembly module TamB
MTIDTKGSQVTVRLFETRNLDITANINTSGAGYPFTAHADFKRYSIERLAGFTRGTLTVSGNAELTGSLKDIAHVTGGGQINPIEIGISNEPIHSTKPFAFAFDSEQLKLLDDVALVSAEGTEFVMNGTVGLTSNARLDLKLTGKVGAGLLTTDKAWTVTGLLDVTGRVGGTVSNPDLQGQASFSDLGIARQGVTASLTALHGSVIFDEHRINLINVEGRSSGGTVAFGGSALIEGSTIGALNVRVVPTGVRVRYPTGLRSVVGGALIVGGTLTTPTLSGDLQIQSMNFNSSFEEFLALFEASPGAGEASPFGNLQLSLRVTGSRNISIQNELASAEARIDLGIKGTLNNPALTGRVETNKGTLLFQGKKYDVTRGNIDFVDPVRIDPVIDIQAEASIRNYLVYLSITGRIEHLQLNMRSEPPLPQLEIVNLMSGGKTTDELVETSRASLAPTGEQVFQGGAASILSDMLVSRVGSKLSLLGLDRNSVRIDPFVVGAQNSTTARITLSKQVTKELSVTYSQDLASNKQQIVQIEYFITRNISVLASKDENNVHGLDLRIRKRF